MNPSSKMLKLKDSYEKRGLSFYYKYDLHWNMLGSYIGYKYLMENIKHYNNGKYSKLTYTNDATIQYSKGIPLLSSSMSYNIIFYPNQLTQDVNIKVNGIAQGNLYKLDKIFEFNNDNKPYSFVFERDSFFFSIIPFIKKNIGDIKIILHNKLKKEHNTLFYKNLRKNQ